MNKNTLALRIYSDFLSMLPNTIFAEDVSKNQPTTEKTEVVPLQLYNLKVELSSAMGS